MNTLLLILLPFLSIAAEVTPSAPVLQCPAVPEEYSRMLMELTYLKSSIKEVANCAPIEKEVLSLEVLLGEKRKEVEALVSKNKEEALTLEEQEIIRTYVEEVTKKVFATVELLGRNSTCFNDDKKNFDFTSLASITLDATTLLKNVGGPWSAPIGLSGQVLAGIFQGIDKLVKSRRGYDFNLLDHRENFVSSLCTYYNYRTDIDQLLYPEKRVAELENLDKNLEGHVDQLARNCPQCGQIVQVNRLLDKLGEGNTALFQQMNDLSKSANQEFVRPLGTYTLQALTTQKWLDEEVERVRGSENVFHIGRDLISEVRSDLDRFLFEKEAPRFIHWQSQKAMNLFREFSDFVKKEGGQKLVYEVAAVMKQYPRELARLDEGQIIDFLQAALPQMRARKENTLAYRIQAFHRKALDLFDRSVIAYNVQATYCNFFKHADVYSQNLAYGCESIAAAGAKRNLERVKMKSRNYNLNVVVFPEQEYSVDWAESLDKLIASLRKDPETFKRR